MRQISAEEYNLLLALSTQCGIDLGKLGLSRTMLVEPLNDGGMGSLRFIPVQNSNDMRRYGGTIIEDEFYDLDKTLVSLAVYIDTDGKLFELDIWKVDFSPLIALPSPEVSFSFRIPSTRR